MLPSDQSSEPLSCIPLDSQLSDHMLNRISSFEDFSKHLRTNAVGPIITAQKLLQTRIPIRSITFMSSDSGSATDFRAFEDGYGLFRCS